MVLDHRRGVFLGVVVAFAVLAGCSEDAQPSTLPDVTSTPSPTPEQSETAEPTPSMDPTATLEAEVEDFIRAYEATLDESWTSEDALAQRRKMFADDCEVCLGGYEIVRDARADGLAYEGERSEILDVDVLDVNESAATALVLADIPAARLIDKAGEVVEQFPPNPNVQLIYDLFQHEDTGWIVVRIEAL